MGWLTLVVVALLTVGCASAPAQAPQPPPPPPKAVDAKAQKIELLLGRADTALAMQALTEPASENAYDLYRAAVLLDPANVRGQEGMKKVAEAYPAQVEEAIVGKQYDAALRKLQKGLVLFPNHSRLREMEGQVRAAKRQQAQMAAKSTSINLPVAELNTKSPTIEATLRDLAKRVATSNELIIIHARNDAEGRWIYKTIKEAAGARLRGDIKISSVPSVQLLRATP